MFSNFPIWFLYAASSLNSGLNCVFKRCLETLEERMEYKMSLYKHGVQTWLLSSADLIGDRLEWKFLFLLNAQVPTVRASDFILDEKPCSSVRATRPSKPWAPGLSVIARFNEKSNNIYALLKCTLQSFLFCQPAHFCNKPFIQSSIVLWCLIKQNQPQNNSIRVNWHHLTGKLSTLLVMLLVTSFPGFDGHIRTQFLKIALESEYNLTDCFYKAVTISTDQTIIQPEG